MLSCLIKNAKKILMVMLIGGILLSGNVYGQENEYININVDNKIEEVTPVWQQRKTDIIIRIGEYGNEETVKNGKRIYLSDVDINFKDIPTDIPIRKDSKGMFISEWDINKKIGERLYQRLKEKGANAELLISSKKSEDLNSAGRRSNEYNPKIYLSVHSNYFENKNSNGYFFMTNPGDDLGANIAGKLSNSISNNGMIRQNKNRINDGYIGEMNVLNKSTVGILLESGFYSSSSDLKYLVSDEYANYLAEEMSNVLISSVNDYWNK